MLRYTNLLRRVFVVVGVRWHIKCHALNASAIRHAMRTTNTPSISRYSMNLAAQYQSSGPLPMHHTASRPLTQPYDSDTSNTRSSPAANACSNARLGQSMKSMLRRSNLRLCSSWVNQVDNTTTTNSRVIRIHTFDCAPQGAAR
jgi:hypothetical protein